MIYLWEIPDDFPNKMIGEHDQDLSPDYIQFRSGQPLPVPESPFVINFEVTAARLRELDVLPNDTLLPLVSARVLGMIRDHEPNCIQPMPTVVRARDGELRDYRILNITKRVEAFDWEASVYTTHTFANGRTGLGRVQRLVLREAAMGNHSMARNSDRLGDILIAEQLCKALVRGALKGLQLSRPHAVS